MTTAPTYAADWATQFLRLAADATAAQITWIDAQLVQAWSTHPVSYWGKDRKRAALLYVGHLWEMEMATTHKDVADIHEEVSLSSEAVGGWSEQQYIPRGPRAGQRGLSASAPGQQYLELRESLSLGPSWGR